MISFPNIVKASRYRLEADEACLRARIAGNETSVPWNSIQELSFAEHEAGMLSVGYVRLAGTDGNEIAWTDHKLMLQADTKYWDEETFQVPASGGDRIPLPSVRRGLLLTSIVIDRAGLVERADGTFVRPDAMEIAVEDTAGLVHESPDDVLQKVGSSSKRLKQVILLVAGFAAASWLWSVHFAIALLVLLMIHEYGHVVAMKWCGVRVSGIFMLPFMGAVALSEEEAPTYWKAFLISYMGPVFGAVITLIAAIALFATGGQTPILREVAFSWAAINLFNLLPLGVLDGGRIVMSISFSTHRAVGILASVTTALLCVLAALSLKSWLLGIVALASFGEMVHGIKQHRLVRRLARMGCDPKNIQKALLACWERLGRVGAEGSSVIAKKARSAKAELGFLRPFFSGKLETPKMTLLQIFGAIGLYLFLFVFFVIILGLTASGGVMASVYHSNRGAAYAEKGQYDLAISEFTNALEINPRYANAYYNRGRTYAATCPASDQAISDFTRAIDINPRLAKSYVGRGAVYYEKGQYDKAWDDVHKAQSLGFQVPSDFLNDLREASERER